MLTAICCSQFLCYCDSSGCTLHLAPVSWSVRLIAHGQEWCLLSRRRYILFLIHHFPLSVTTQALTLASESPLRKLCYWICNLPGGGTIFLLSQRIESCYDPRKSFTTRINASNV